MTNVLLEGKRSSIRTNNNANSDLVYLFSLTIYKVGLKGFKIKLELQNNFASSTNYVSHCFRLQNLSVNLLEGGGGLLFKLILIKASTLFILADLLH